MQRSRPAQGIAGADNACYISSVGSATLDPTLLLLCDSVVSLSQCFIARPDIYALALDRSNAVQRTTVGQFLVSGPRRTLLGLDKLAFLDVLLTKARNLVTRPVKVNKILCIDKPIQCAI